MVTSMTKYTAGIREYTVHVLLSLPVSPGLPGALSSVLQLPNASRHISVHFNFNSDFCTPEKGHKGLRWGETETKSQKQFQLSFEDQMRLLTTSERDILN